MGATIALGLLGALCFAVADLLNTRLSRGLHATTTLTWTFAVALVPLVVLALVAGDVPEAGDGPAVLRAAVAGVLYVLALGALLLGLRRGDLSIVSPLTALEGGVAAVIAVARGEQLVALAAVGLVLAVLGGALAAVAGRPAEASGARSRTAAGAGWGLLAALLFGLSFVVLGEAEDGTAAATSAIVLLAGLVVVAPCAVALGRLAVPRGWRGITVGAGLLEAVGLLASAAALARGPVAIAAVLLAQFGTFAALLGVVVLGERPARHQVVGVVVTLVAVSLLAASGS